jgi:hypothetical protein
VGFQISNFNQRLVGIHVHLSGIYSSRSHG